MNFNVGDRVRATNRWDTYTGQVAIGDEGTILYAFEESLDVGVMFDRDVGGHDLGEGLNCPGGHGWYTPIRWLEDVTSEASVDVTDFL